MRNLNRCFTAELLRYLDCTFSPITTACSLDVDVPYSRSSLVADKVLLQQRTIKHLHKVTCKVCRVHERQTL